ncbi:hypothetical protein [Flammeovirga kamogawensis]|uniref:PKD domain-containing protein n=1 Tax=Flammeovirga kamogawensis TaxID=373891 RepID=A0ABX8GZY8_9BACT|nr:hypothetical protein [Flammeovirga kamogawensis]MBB6459078.1 hypothetical protein [Flammeovirga kamogawensis]QWG08647.1 hypothetical protein KM029_06835 [Flammeovirga kamogawensis]TRX66940.1 hypothetical protein EO216_01880 [Flammeovirga kamogawensis]
MKKYIYSFLSLVVLLGMTACTEDKPDVGPAPTSDDVTFTMQPTSDNPNIIQFTNTTPGSIAYWNYYSVINDTTEEATGNDKGDIVTAPFALAGNYRVTLTIVSKGGQATSEKAIVIENTDFSLLDTPDFNNLTGGIDSINGKVWKFERFVIAHNGLGPVETQTPDWWKSAKNQKPTLGHYDDELTFNLYNFKYDLNNNGDSHVLPAAKDLFMANYGGTVKIDAGGDGFNIATDLTTTDWKWAITEKDGKKFLELKGDAFLSWYVGDSKEFEIIELTAEHLYLRTIGADGNAWYYGFAPKAIADVEPPIIEKPLEVKDIYDNFADSSNITFVTDADLDFTVGFPNIDVSGNDAENVGRYVRTESEGDAGWWQNYQAELPFRLDLSTRNVFKMKIYFLPSNDYTTATPAASTPDWLGDVAMSSSVALRLENSLDEEAWRTRAESSYNIIDQSTGRDESGEWIEVTFDFKTVNTDANKDWSYSVPAINNTFYDKIIIQIGGEGHTRPGTFYISDFRLEQ